MQRSTLSGVTPASCAAHLCKNIVPTETLALEDPRNRELMARQENGLQQLVLMVLNDNPIVAEQTCETLTLLAKHSAPLAEAVADNDLDAVMRLLDSGGRQLQLRALEVLASVAFASSVAGERAATPQVLASLERLVTRSGSSTDVELRTTALKAVGNLAFSVDNRGRLARHPALMRCIAELSSSSDGAVRLRMAAVRVLAILGENDVVQRAVGREPVGSRGLRILSLDGGGMKGMATVKLLRELEQRMGQRIHEAFDLIGASRGRQGVAGTGCPDAAHRRSALMLALLHLQSAPALVGCWPWHWGSAK